MDFVSYIRDQKEKLNCSDYVFHLWSELNGSNTDVDINSGAVQDFINHLPLQVEQFWQFAANKLSETATLDEIDDELKVYLLVLIYQCLTQSQDVTSFNSVLYASDVYLRLLATQQSEDFYKNKLFRGVLTALQSSAETNSCTNLTNQVMHDLRLFLSKSKMNDSDLEVTLAALVQLVFVKTGQVFQNFDATLELRPIAQEALLSLKVLLEGESIPTRKFLINTYLLNGLKKHSTIHITPRNFTAIQINFRHLLKSLHCKFKEDHYETFMNAFVHSWHHQNFAFYSEAVIIMNGLKEKYYRRLLDVLNKMMLTKSPSRNLFKLSLAIVCCPPRYIPTEKIQVTNEILLKLMLTNRMSQKTDVSNCAVESLAELLVSPDLEKEHTKQPMKMVLNGLNDANLDVPTILKGMLSLRNKKWGPHSKNRNLFVIVVSVIMFAEEDCPQVFREVLDTLTEEASPFDLKTFIPLLSDTYITLTNKKWEYSALQILKVIFKMSLHPMASSTEFVKFLYNSVFSLNVFKGAGVVSSLVIDHVISDGFNYVEFFKKCHALGLIRTQHIARLMSSLPTISEKNLKLLCAVVHLSDYKELSMIADHINDNFVEMCKSDNLNYLFFVYSNILKNTASECSNSTLKSNEIMVCFIKHHLLTQSFRWNCVANAFALLNNLEEFTDLQRDYSRLKEKYDARLSSALQGKDNFLPVLYHSQLVIFGKLLPSEENTIALTSYLSLCSNELYRRSPEFQPKFWIGCLLLYTNMSVIKTNLIDSCFGYLQEGLNSSVTDVKLASINMNFDLCNMLTHTFDELIRYMFRQLVYGDVVFKMTCLVKIDRLIRDDYLKLEFEQFLVFVSLLGDRNITLSDRLKQMLSENFFISNSILISRYFVPFIVHINGYKKHPMYTLSDGAYEIMTVVSRNVLDRRKIYKLLFTSLPIKCRFNIIYLLTAHILENVMNGTVKVDDGFWNIIKDSIFIFKLLTLKSEDEEPAENHYKKIVGHITRDIVHKSNYNEKPLYQEYNKEVVKGTEVLLKLLFFNDWRDVQKHISISVFDGIVHWTSFFMADLVHIVHVDRHKVIQGYYTKFEKYYKTNGQSLKYSEESFENRSSTASTTVAANPQFNVARRYVPLFDGN